MICAYNILEMTKSQNRFARDYGGCDYKWVG